MGVCVCRPLLRAPLSVVSLRMCVLRQRQASLRGLLSARQQQPCSATGGQSESVSAGPSATHFLCDCGHLNLVHEWRWQWWHCSHCCCYYLWLEELGGMYLCFRCWRPRSLLYAASLPRPLAPRIRGKLTQRLCTCARARCGSSITQTERPRDRQSSRPSNLRVSQAHKLPSAKCSHFSFREWATASAVLGEIGVQVGMFVGCFSSLSVS